MSIITEAAKARRRQLCNRLALERTMLNLTQRDMAAHFGDRQSNVQTIESSKRCPQMDTFIAYAAALGLEVALVAEHHLPLLDLTADEVRMLTDVAREWDLQYGGDPALVSALDKLTPGPADTVPSRPHVDEPRLDRPIVNVPLPA